MDDRFLRLIFSEIIQGTSPVRCKFGTVFIRHFNSKDLGELESRTDNLYKHAQSIGIATKEERENFIKNQGLWTPQDEIDEINLSTSLSTMKLTKTKLIKEREKTELGKAISQTEQELDVLKLKKTYLIGDTCEKYVAKKFNEFCIYYAFYKDKECKIRCFTDDEFGELEEQDISDLVQIYASESLRFKEKNFQKIAIANFFINLFNLSDDDPVRFYGMPVVNLTFYQAELFNYALYFKPILQEWRDKLTEDILNDPDKLIEMAVTNKNADEMLAKSNMGDTRSTKTSIVGASRKELEKLGGEIISYKHLTKGGKIGTMEEVIKAHGL